MIDYLFTVAKLGCSMALSTFIFFSWLINRLKMRILLDHPEKPMLTTSLSLATLHWWKLCSCVVQQYTHNERIMSSLLGPQMQCSWYPHGNISFSALSAVLYSFSQDSSKRGIVKNNSVKSNQPYISQSCQILANSDTKNYR